MAKNGVPIEDRFRVGTRKMRRPGNRNRGTLDETVLIYNDYLTLRGIPPEARRHMVGQYSALRRLMERRRVKTDKDSGIVNAPNDWSDEVGDPRYILDLAKRVITVVEFPQSANAVFSPVGLLQISYPCKPVKGEGICRSRFVLDFGRRVWLQPSGFPLSRE